ncbi:MAG: PAS domain S-box protein, partial [Gammaproteobacteria bacterium]|nr:PAS domain S-box protein [Gammaproteobacteria bacterium]
MSIRPLPQSTRLPAAADADLAATLAALETAGNDTALPAAHRELLGRACDALRAAHAEAETAQLRYHALFDAVPDPVSILDENGIVLDLNKAGISAYRRPREDIVGQPIETLNPDLPKDHMGPVWETLDRGETYVIEVTNMRADGSRFPVEVHSAGFVHDGRNYIVAVARDLSARREAELKFRELFEAIDKGVIVQDADGRPVQVNAAALRILGVADRGSFEDYLRPEDWRVLDESGRPVAREDWPMWRTLRTGHTMQSTVLGMYHQPERRLRWLSVTTVPVFAPGSTHPRQVISLFSDVTDLKRDSALFDRAQELAHIGGWEWEIAPNRLYLTDEALRILGQARPPQTMDALLGALRMPDAQRLQAASAYATERGS